MVTIERVVQLLKRTKLPLSDEKLCQQALANALTAAEIPYEREVRINGGKIDFMVGSLGLEIKIKKGQKRAIWRQIEKYLTDDRLSHLILATGLSMSTPSKSNGKGITVVSLGGAWL